MEDAVAVEAPLEVRIGGKPIYRTDALSHDDEELVTGFLFNEGVISDPDDIISLEAEGENILEVRLMIARKLPASGYSSATPVAASAGSNRWLRLKSAAAD